MGLDILKNFENNKGQLLMENLQTIIARRDESIPELLEILEYTCNNAEEFAKRDDYSAHIYTCFLLAQFREQRAYPLICNLISNPKANLDDLLGGFITEGLTATLASVYNGDISLLKDVIENQQIDEYIRGAAVYALVVLVVNGIVPRDEIVEYFRSLLKEKLERKQSNVWDALAISISDIYPGEVIEEVKLAYDQRLIDLGYIGFEEIKKQMDKGQEAVLQEARDNFEYRLVDDAFKELKFWVGFNPEKNFDEKNQNKAAKSSFKKEPVVKEVKVGRNDPCPCGSGKKYKKCCG